MASHICTICTNDGYKTLYTRKRPEGTFRRRQCLNCGHRWTTIEVNAEEFIKIQEQANALKRAMLVATGAMSS